MLMLAPLTLRLRHVREANSQRAKMPEPPIYSTTLLRPGYLSQKLTRPVVTKDGGTLRTVLDARSYMLRLSKARRDTRWQRAAELLLGEGRCCRFHKAVELAL